MSTSYLIRLDDACPTMMRSNWNRVEHILDKYGIRPLVGVIPANADPSLIVNDKDPMFWKKVNNWQNKGWEIALHGYDHRYISDSGGLNPIWNRSEFAGLPLETQKQKISNGIDILKSHGINCRYFFAPSHTFDLNTLRALRDCSDIRFISDTMALKPYIFEGFTFVPQFSGHCVKVSLPGTFTFCLHPAMMSDKNMTQLEEFLKINSDKFIAFSDISPAINKKDWGSKLLAAAYSFYRKLKN